MNCYLNKFKILLLITLFIAFCPAYLFSQNKYILNLTENWKLAKEDSLNVYLIDSSSSTNLKTLEITKFCTSKITCLLSLGNNKILFGTTSDFVWFYQNGKLDKLDQSFGISDSNIVSISMNRKRKKIFVETDKNGFVSINPAYKRFARFTRTYDENPVQDSIFRDFNRRHLSRFFWHPLRSLSRNVMPYIAEKESDEDSCRKLTRADRDTINAKLEPGDIILERKNGLLTNAFISGFWTHSAIYIGNLKQINAYFEGMPLLNGLSPAKYIRKHYPAVYRKLLRVNKPIIESVTKGGVIISPLRKVTKVDYFALIRTKLDKEDKFLSLLKAFEFYKLPYDFGFDLSDEDAVFCSGLIYKSFGPSQIKNGLNFQIKTLLGSPMMNPGDLAIKFDNEYDTQNSELQLILFIDSNQESPGTTLKSANEFRKTWIRH